MGDSKIINKFQRLLEECEKEHIYQGTILDFVKVDYVPKERHVSGIIVTGKKGTHRVEFASGPKKYIENVSQFRIGDEVMVLGKENQLRSNTTTPSIILLPEEDTIVLSKEHGYIKMQRWADYAQAVLFFFAIILGVISWIGDFVFTFLLGPYFHPYPLIITLSAGGAALLILGVILLELYSQYDYRERVIRCDPDTWISLNNEIILKFGS